MTSKLASTIWMPTLTDREPLHDMILFQFSFFNIPHLQFQTIIPLPGVFFFF